MNVDWEALRAAAATAAARAYAPYSGLRVGAAGQDREGVLVTGCNVENASYGLTLCAECGLVSAQRAAGAGPLVAVAVVAGDGAPLVPCGRCRQLLIEAGGPELLLDADGGPVRLGDLLFATWNSVISRSLGASPHPDSDTTFATSRGAPQVEQLTRSRSFWNWHHEQTIRSTIAAPSRG